jgi:hypothetical protein
MDTQDMQLLKQAMWPSKNLARHLLRDLRTAAGPLQSLLGLLVLHLLPQAGPGSGPTSERPAHPSLAHFRELPQGTLSIVLMLVSMLVVMLVVVVVFVPVVMLRVARPHASPCTVPLSCPPIILDLREL